MKKLLFSLISLSVLNAGVYTGFDIGAAKLSQSFDENVIKNMAQFGLYLKSYKEKDSESSFVGAIKMDYNQSTYELTINNERAYKDTFSQTSFKALVGYGFYESSSIDTSFNILLGLGVNNAKLKSSIVEDSVSANANALILGLGGLMKFGETKQFMISFDGYYNHYTKYEDFENRSKNAIDVELGALYKFSKDDSGTFASIKAGRKDILFSEKTGSSFVNIGLGYKF